MERGRLRRALHRPRPTQDELVVATSGHVRVSVVARKLMLDSTRFGFPIAPPGRTIVWLAPGSAGYGRAFEDHAIDSRSLPSLTEDGLEELGLELGHRRIPRQAIAALEAGSPVPSVTEEGITMSVEKLRSPRIARIAWGRMEIAGVGAGKDFKLWPGGGREWDWRETGTRHVPGIQPADIEELIEHGSETLVLSRGMLLMLRTCPETLALLERRRIPVQVAETKAAAAIYNRLAAAGEPVGGLFHSTC